MAIGTVKFFDSKKGYGFIVPDDGGPDVFVHVTALDRAGLDTLMPGQAVEFTLSPTRNGKVAAANLRVRCRRD